MEGYDAESDTDLVQEIYPRKSENDRLNKSQAARVEFLTTVRFIEKYLAPGAKILDVGAGAGEYSFYFARKGYSLSALELADANIAAFRAKMTEYDSIDLVQGNALDLSRYDSNPSMFSFSLGRCIIYMMKRTSCGALKRLSGYARKTERYLCFYLQ